MANVAKSKEEFKSAWNEEVRQFNKLRYSLTTQEQFDMLLQAQDLIKRCIELAADHTYGIEVGSKADF